MRILLHTAGVLLFCCLFILGKLMIEGREIFAQTLAQIPGSYAHLCKFFLYGGRIFIGLAVVLGFIEFVVVMILTSGWVVDLFLPAMI
ncbi:MAG TPA: hypothetical protein VGR47_07190 [Terracidiphilus sp.]|nr:hypothetical protein [Terracidiphilus sp.]